MGMPWFFVSQFVGKFSGEKGIASVSGCYRWRRSSKHRLFSPSRELTFVLSTLEGRALRKAALFPPTSKTTPQKLIKALTEKYRVQRSPDTFQE